MSLADPGHCKRVCEPAACPLCKAGAPRARHVLAGGRILYDCANCGGSYCVPFAAPPAGFYERASDLGSTARHAGPSEWYRDHPARSSPFFQPGRQGRLLDVGCGNGAFAAFAASVGYELTGLEVDSTSLDVARSRGVTTARFEQRTLADFCTRSQAGTFDVVTMFEVFEHLDNPPETLEQVRWLLREGGLFIGSLPNTERLLMWRLHMDYEMPPYHLTYWSVKSWQKYLCAHQFDVPTCESTIYYGYMADVMMYKYKLPRPVPSVVGRILRPLELALERRWKCGASIYFEARRV